MFWIPYLLEREGKVTVHYSVDPGYDYQVRWSKEGLCQLWTLTYPLPTFYAWELVKAIRKVLTMGLSRWRLLWRIKSKLKEWGLPTRVCFSLCKPEAQSGLWPIQDLSLCLGNRLLTEGELVKELTGKPLAWPGFELSLQDQLLKGQIQMVPGIVSTPGGRLRCTRCGSYHIVAAPCTRCGHNQCYACQSCAGLRVIRGCTALFTSKSRMIKAHHPPGVLKFKLTKAQERLLAGMEAFLTQPDETCLVDAVCGAGKGYVILEFLRRLILRQETGSILFTTPRRSVLEEWAEEYAQVLGKDNLSVIYGQRHEYRPQAIVTMATLPQVYRFLNAFEILLVDEADAFPLGANPHYWPALYRALKPKSKQFLFTATPQELTHFPSAFTLRLPARYHGRILPVPQVVSVKTEEELFQEAFKLVRVWSSQEEIRIFVFVPTKTIQKKVLSYFTEKGYTGNIGSYNGDMRDLSQKLEAFRQGKIRIAISTILLERGITINPCAVLVLEANHANFTTASLVQMAGRAGRSAKHPYGEVIYLIRGDLSEQAARAIQHIQEENKEASRKGYLYDHRDQKGTHPGRAAT